MRELRDQVVVITGASSGIGRATAHAFARHGAALVLVARSEEALREVAAECEARGGRPIVAAADVADEAAVRAVARRAIDAHGRIDVWVNDAAVTHFGRFEDVPSEVFRRVFEVNFFGYVHGIRAVLPHLLAQREGLIVNVASVVGRVPQPFTTAYTTSKFAIRALSRTLREELRGSGVHVSTILPPSIDTPIFQHGANHSGRQVKPVDPVYSARTVARAIVRCARRPRREVNVGASASVMALLERVLPGAVLDRLSRSGTERQHFRDAPAAASEGNVFRSTGPHAVSGGWRADGSKRPSRTFLPVVAAAALVPLAARTVARWAR